VLGAAAVCDKGCKRCEQQYKIRDNVQASRLKLYSDEEAGAKTQSYAQSISKDRDYLKTK
jgi:hypothetical protein